MVEISIPRGAASHTVSVIDSTSMLANITLTDLIAPALPDVNVLPTLPAFSFLVTDSTGKRKVLFDLAYRKDPENLAPVVRQRITMGQSDLSAEKGVKEVIEDHGLPAHDIEAIIWSHPHLDHTGDPSTFPATTDLVVGPGFKKTMLPGYPANPDSPILQSDYEGRNLVEIDFTANKPLKIGRFPAFDYFGDGSFYLLDAPGHAPGNMSGLVRTTTLDDGKGDTFIFLGGDAVHHGGQFRPSTYRPLPKSVLPNPLAPIGIDSPIHRKHASIPFCPGEAIEHLQVSRNRVPADKVPFFDPAAFIDFDKACETVKKVQEVDCRDDMFILFAHDESAVGVVDTFPKPANQWKEKGWAEKIRWRFLKDLGGAIYKDFGRKDNS